MVRPESWKPVVGFEKRYEISDLGRIRSLGNGSGRYPFGTTKTLSIANKGRGYSGVCLWANNKGASVYIHHLVARAFIGPRPAKFEINHIDGNKANNHVGNLEYVTSSQNKKHGVAIGQYKVGEKNPSAKLLNSDIPIIKEMFKCGAEQKLIADVFQVSRSVISVICSGKSWKSECY